MESFQRKTKCEKKRVTASLSVRLFCFGQKAFVKMCFTLAALSTASTLPPQVPFAKCSVRTPANHTDVENGKFHAFYVSFYEAKYSMALIMLMHTELDTMTCSMHNKKCYDDGVLVLGGGGNPRTVRWLGWAKWVTTTHD